MEGYMTAKELAEVAKVDVSTIQKIAKKLYPNKERVRGKDTLYNQEECYKIIEETRKKGFITKNENFALSNGNFQLDNGNFQLLSEIKTLIENQNKIILELSKRIDKIENQKSLPKPEIPNKSSENEVNINFEWLYISRIAKYLECNTKMVYDALYQLQFLSLDKYSGSYKITEKGNDYLKWQNNSLMIKNVLISDIKKIVSIWKKNSKSLF